MKNKTTLKQLMKKKGIEWYVDLLKNISDVLKARGMISPKVNSYDFSKQHKAAFSHMLYGDRPFSLDFIIAMEEFFGEPFDYICPEEGDVLAVGRVDECGEIVDKDRLMEESEYQKYLNAKSDFLRKLLFPIPKNRLEYFASQDLLPLNDIGLKKETSLITGQYPTEDVYCGVIQECREDVVLRYCNDRRFFEASHIHDPYEEEMRQHLTKTAKHLISRPGLWGKLCQFKRIPLDKINPNKTGIIGKEGGFCGVYHRFLHEVSVDEEKSYYLIRLAIEANKAIIETVESLGYEHYQVDDDGIIYADDIVCGSVVVLDGPLYDEPRSIDAYRRYADMLALFLENHK